jgi:hypothetical protein
LYGPEVTCPAQTHASPAYHQTIKSICRSSIDMRKKP